MSWSFNPDSVESLNDRAFRDLKIGTHDYTITGCKLFEKANSPSKILFSLENGGTTYTAFLDVMAVNADTAKIAAQTLKAFMQAAGLSGVMVVDRLKSFANKKVSITTTATKKEQPNADGSEAFWVNIKSVDAVSAPTASASAEPPVAPANTYIAPAPEPVEAPPSDAAPVTTPASAATPPGGAPPWKRASA